MSFKSSKSSESTKSTPDLIGKESEGKHNMGAED